MNGLLVHTYLSIFTGSKKRNKEQRIVKINRFKKGSLTLMYLLLFLYTLGWEPPKQVITSLCSVGNVANNKQHVDAKNFLNLSKRIR